MISSLSGAVQLVQEDHLVLDIQGVGFKVFAPVPLLLTLKPGQTLSLTTCLIVRQDALSLYGFSSQEDHTLFEMLLGVNRVGPKLALAILSALDASAIKRAVINSQVEILNNVSGVGRKTAQSILLHLQDKIKGDDMLEPLSKMDSADTDILDALVALGYSVVEAQTALQNIPQDAPEDVEERLRIALSYFSRS